ncbi:MAG: polysaccharide biosynthesis protein [Deltaproteobacteria bacterium]|nr:polysaccharide biosynthesis protein [Deltaproteobacteria bacterium]
MKRLFDILFSVVALLMLAPLFLIVAILIKMESRGPVFFRQKRIGRGFIPFTLYTFRITAGNLSQQDLAAAAGGDVGSTRVGGFLRKTRLSGLPQIWNVFKGDMSIVGPHPELEKYVYKYVDDYNVILNVRPGIIGVASSSSDEESILSGREDPEDYYIHVLLPDKIKLAKGYVKRASLHYDLELMVLTLINLLYPYKTFIRTVEALLPYRRLIVVVAELTICVISIFLAFYIRFDGAIPPPHLELLLKYLPLLILIRGVFLFAFSLDRGLWQYASVKDLFNITAAVSLGTLFFFAIVRYLFGELGYPRSIYVVDWFFNIFLLGGVRLLWRLHRERGIEQGTKKRVIVIGAGNAADMLLRDLESSPFYSYHVIGLIDDNLRKKKLKIRGIPIIGTRKDLSTIVEREEPDEFLVAMPSVASSVIQEVVKELRQYGLPVKMLPGLMGMLSGKSSLEQIKMVEPEDVLFRPPAHAEHIDVKSLMQGKRVMITGAGGSIGSELSRQVAALSPESLILFERHEESLFNLDMGLAKGHNSHIIPIIGDILDQERVREVMERYRPQIVFHAAAYKHVPLMEGNPYEAFRTNVVGSRIVAEAAGEFGVERFVLISTDKAVNAVNVMGRTKRVAEELIRHISKEERHSTRYLIVRFGNVLGSSGSVVPIFKEQIKRGGPVTVTHPEMTRFFMTIPEAVALVLQAAAMGRGGDVFVLDMGEPVKIIDLARRMISLYGLKVGKDIDIKITGLRPGEKLFEELFNEDEVIEKTAHPKISMAVANVRINHHIGEFLSEPYAVRGGDDVKEMLERLAH